MSFVSFDVSWFVHEHPEQNKDMAAIMQKIVSHLRIGTIPSFLSYCLFVIMREICGPINNPKKLSRPSLRHVLKVLRDYLSLLMNRPMSDIELSSDYEGKFKKAGGKIGKLCILLGRSLGARPMRAKG